MKKIFWAALAIVTVIPALSSCGNGKDDSESNDSADKKSAVNYSPQADSLAVYRGSAMGVQFNAQWEQMLAQMPEDKRANFSKSVFLQGFKDGLSVDTTLNYMMGFQAGLSELAGFFGPASQLEPIDIMKYYEAFAGEFNKKTADLALATMNQDKFMQLWQTIQQEKQRRDEAATNSSQEAFDNEQAAKEFMEQMMAEEPSIASTPSGLYYKIMAPGASQKIGPNDQLKLRYVMRHIDGEVIDQQENPVSMGMAGMIPGVNEGLQLIGKGGKIVLFIPGKLAYGSQGTPQGGIGPNEMLVFQAEVTEVN